MSQEKKPLKLSHKMITILVTPELERIREKIQEEFDERFKMFSENEKDKYSLDVSTGLRIALDIIDEETMIEEESRSSSPKDPEEKHWEDLATHNERFADQVDWDEVEYDDGPDLEDEDTVRIAEVFLGNYGNSGRKVIYINAKDRPRTEYLNPNESTAKDLLDLMQVWTDDGYDLKIGKTK